MAQLRAQSTAGGVIIATMEELRLLEIKIKSDIETELEAKMNVLVQNELNAILPGELDQRLGEDFQDELKGKLSKDLSSMIDVALEEALIPIIEAINNVDGGSFDDAPGDGFSDF